jgi:hypothetical protein
MHRNNRSHALERAQRHQTYVDHSLPPESIRLNSAQGSTTVSGSIKRGPAFFDPLLKEELKEALALCQRSSEHVVL